MSDDLFARLGPDFLQNPYLVYEMLRSAGPVTWAPGVFGIGGFIVTSHALCGSVLRSKSFIKEGERVLSPEQLAKIPQEREKISERRKANMLFRDPPDHTRLRGLVNQAFTPRVVERLRPHVASIAEHLLDAMEKKRPSADLIHEYAFALPIIVIAELLGVPPEDRDMFKAWSTDLTLGLSPNATPEDLDRVQRAIAPMDAYLHRVIEERRKEPRADLISELVRVQDAGDKLSMNELTATCRLLLTAGHETTVNLIGNGMLALLRNRDQLEALKADPSLLHGAVEELLRYDSPVQMTMRFAFDDETELGGKTVKRGDLLMLILGAGNRDAEVFEEPNRLDVKRANAAQHLSLGGGIHYCLGAPLARIEGELAIGALLRRFPDIALAEGPLKYRKNLVLRGLESLPVTF